MLIGTGQRLRNVQVDEVSVVIDGFNLERVNKATCLGVVIDDELLWHKHVNSVIQKVFCKTALLRRLNSFLDTATLNILYKSLN